MEDLTIHALEFHESSLKAFFTELHIVILKKKLRGEQLSANEKTYYYKYIKPRMKALLSFIGEAFIKGREYILPERIPRAEALLANLSRTHKGKKIMISGSFLFSKRHNDIDAFVFTTYQKEDYWKGKVHVTFLKESSIDTLFFSSLSQISISNFIFQERIPFLPSLKEVLYTYELLINHIFNKDPYEKELRDFLIQTEFAGKQVILNPQQLYMLTRSLKKPKILRIISEMLINCLVTGYDNRTIRREISTMIEQYQEINRQYQTKNIEEYLHTYAQVIDIAT